MRLYLAGPLFTEAERRFLDDFATTLEAAGHECFVPHRQTFPTLDPATVFATDAAGVLWCEALVAWLDGPSIDDGTACEIGMFAECCRREPERYRGMVGLATDWRTWRRRDVGSPVGGLNLFVAGAIEANGRVVWTIEDVVGALASMG